MNLEFLKDFYVPIVLIACLVVGYCIKHIKWLDKVSNEYIPTILALLGAAVSVISALWSNTPVSLETIVYGAFTGLASTGLHQAFTKIIDKTQEGK